MASSRSTGSRSKASRRAASSRKTTPPRKSTPARRAGGRGKETKPGGKKILLLLTLLAGGVVTVIAVLAGFLDGYGHRARAQKADAIVVLGARVREDGQPGHGLKMRVLHAVRLYKKGYAPRIVFTGGVGTNPPAEAHAAAEFAMQNGVPRKAIVEEAKSASTWENAAFAAAICKQRGWGNVILVSDPFHLWRAERNFQKNGIATSASPVAVEQWRLQPARKLLWTSREAVLVARDWVLRRV